MASPSDSLPDDIEALRAFAMKLIAGRDAAMAERDRLIAQNDRFRHLLKQLERMHFGRKSEKLDADQFNLALEDVEQVIAKCDALEDKKVQEPGMPRPKR